MSAALCSIFSEISAVCWLCIKDETPFISQPYSLVSTATEAFIFFQPLSRLLGTNAKPLWDLAMSFISSQSTSVSSLRLESGLTIFSLGFAQIWLQNLGLHISEGLQKEFSAFYSVPCRIKTDTMGHG